MKHKYIKFLISTLIILGLGFLFWYIIHDDNFSFHENPKGKVAFSKEEEQLIGEEPKVNIVVDEKLNYLRRDSLLDQIVVEILKPAKMELHLSDDNSDGYKNIATLAIINETNRGEFRKQLISKPLFQVEGRLFKNKNLEKKSKYTVFILTGDFTAKEKRKLSYDGVSMEAVEFSTMAELIKKTEKEVPDFIIVRENPYAINIQYGKTLDNFQDTGQVAYRYNVVLVIPRENLSLYGALNKVIQNSPRKDIIQNIINVQKRAFPIETEENKHTYNMVLLVIVFLSVFGGFFIYYISTANLYAELTKRMNQLTESKNEMETTFNEVSSCMAELDREGKISVINRFMGEALNINIGQVMGLSIATVMNMSKEDSFKLEETRKRILAGGKGENSSINIDKKVFYIQLHPICNRKQAVDKLLFMATDVSNLKLAERQMLQQSKMIAVGQLAAGVAHEIRNPLGLIRNYCYLLKNLGDEEIEERKKAIAIIEKSVETSGQIINSLLNFSRVGGGIPEAVNIREHIEELLFIQKGHMKTSNVNISLAYTEEVKGNVILDTTSLDMILINLLQNAVDAIENSGNININIHVKEDILKIEITDTGCGIDKDVIGDIFNPFFTCKGSNQGNGLGLYIVYNEVEKMNGTIEVESEKNIGTTFRISIEIMGRG